MILLQYAWGLLAKNRRMFGSWFILMIATGCVAAIPPVIIGRMVDVAIPSEQFHAIVYFSIGIVGSFLASSLLQSSSKLMLEMMVNKVASDLKSRVFALFHRKHLRSLMSIGTDLLYQRATQTVKVLQEKIVLIMRDVIGITISAIISIVIIMSIDPLIPVLFLLVFVPYIYLRRTIFRKKGYTFYEQAESYGQIINTVREMVQGLRLIRASGTETAELQRFEERQQHYMGIQIKHIHVFSSLLLLNVLMTLIPEVIVYGYMGYKVYQHDATIGNMIVISGLLGQIRAFVWQVSRYGMMTREFKEHLGRIYELEQLPDESVMHQSTENESSLVMQGEIEFRNVVFKYDRIPVLDGFNLRIKQGKAVGIVGLSGAGKTTLAHLILGLETPEKGQLLLDGVHIAEWPMNRLRNNISFITQQPYLLNTSIRENLAYGMDIADELVLRHALSQAQLREFVESLPEGLDTLIGEQGVQLSGGQKQRLSIARAYISNPRVLILDEATSALDMVSEQLVQASLEKLCEGRTSIIIAHRLATLRHVDEIIVLKDGIVVEQGSPEELMVRRQYYYRLFMEQFSSNGERMVE